MILIADSGSTKTDWVLIDETNQSRYKTIGYNPYFTNSENIYHSLSEKLVPEFEPAVIKKVFFYGAGCSTNGNAAIVSNALTRCFINSEISVGHDMLAAARALLGNQKGFAAIIGTGSNTCLYDGCEIEKNIDSLGYLMGDEGSGSYIGKKIVRDFMRRYLPVDLQKDFEETYHISNSDIFDCIYNKPLPNRFLAGFCMFADKHKEHSYIVETVRESFNDFFRNLVSRYPEYQSHAFNCVGSAGYIFREILGQTAKEYGMRSGKIIHSPIDDLVEYHLTHK
ncbi:MAG: N-acetylglucosamine kinase [Bacteroidetes bacterium]|nr:N-acetylglucosamine kinase [Bacteroidota bacterium]